MAGSQAEDDLAGSPPSRHWLLIKTIILRVLMRIGMFIHSYPLPWPPSPAFSRSIKTGSRKSVPVELYFYTPKDYREGKQQGRKYPVVVNFHGGGFCLGRATDDCRWARTVIEATNAVVVSVDYRLAPEFPFPAAVDDGVEALLYLETHADELALDVSRVALSGFSAGGNLAFSVPLRLHTLSRVDTSSSSNTIPRPELKHYESSELLLQSAQTSSDSKIQIVAICSWYPVLDFVLEREIRRSRSAAPEKTLSPILTDLFDSAYLPDLEDRASPFASPGRASDSMLAEALPTDIFMYMCEWDMLLTEGMEMVQRLEHSGKKVRSMMIERSTHAWDKSVNPFRDQSSVDVLYRAACEEIRRVFGH